MKRLMFFVLLIACVGCKRNQPVSNAATDYAHSLQTDVVKAREAADKANQSISRERETSSQAQDAAQ